MTITVSYFDIIIFICVPLNRIFHVFSVDLAVILCKISHCLPFLYTLNLFSHTDILLFLLILYLYTFLLWIVGPHG